MTNPAKKKGDRAELEIAGILTDQLGVRIRRKLGAGRADDTGDLDGLTETVVQVKNFKDITRGLNEALNQLPAQQANAGATFAVAFIRRPGNRWAAVMTVEQFCTLWREATG